MAATWLEQLDQAGYAMLPGVLSASEVASALDACSAMLNSQAGTDSVLADADGAAYGARNVLRLCPGVFDVVRKAEFEQSLIQALGRQCGLVRVLYFDKPPGHSWALPWHRDKTIAVKDHGPIGEFKKLTTKAGVPHVEAPVSILETMLTARIHLDDMTDKNGPLRVIPGSHRQRSEAGISDQAAVTLHCAAGDVLLMRPLLLHASGHSEAGHDRHRRILHLEFAASPQLKTPYAWHDFFAVGQQRQV